MTSPSDGIPPQTSLCAAFHIRKTARVVSRYFDQVLAPSGLRSTQFAILSVVAALPGESVSVIAERLGMDHSTLVRNLRLLTADRLVAARRGDDRRTRRLAITTEGEAALERAMPLWHRAQTTILAGLDGDVWPQVVERLKALRRAATHELMEAPDGALEDESGVVPRLERPKVRASMRG